MPFTWVVTKSQPHADSVVIQLRRQGFDALAVCCIEHRWQDWPALKQLGEGYRAVFGKRAQAPALRSASLPSTHGRGLTGKGTR